MKQWPARGPAALWSCGGLGEEFSSVAIANGVVYTCGMIRDQGYLFAIDSQGKMREAANTGPIYRSATDTFTSATATS